VTQPPALERGPKPFLGPLAVDSLSLLVVCVSVSIRMLQCLFICADRIVAPDIQEEILHLPRTVVGRDPIPETRLRPIVQLAE